MLEPSGTYDVVLRELDTHGVWLQTGMEAAPSSGKRNAAELRELLASAGDTHLSPQTSAVVGRDILPSAELRAGLASDGFAKILSDLDAWHAAEDDENMETVCLLLSGHARVIATSEAVNHVRTLPDGAQIVMSTYAGADAFDSMRLSLRGPLADWVEGHPDHRGVLAFRDSLFDSAAQAGGYDAVVEHVGRKGKWLKLRHHTRRE